MYRLRVNSKFPQAIHVDAWINVDTERLRIWFIALVNCIFTCRIDRNVKAPTFCHNDLLCVKYKFNYNRLLHIFIFLQVLFKKILWQQKVDHIFRRLVKETMDKLCFVNCQFWSSEYKNSFWFYFRRLVLLRQI
jgi:hypothetical protein